MNFKRNIRIIKELERRFNKDDEFTSENIDIDGKTLSAFADETDFIEYMRKDITTSKNGTVPERVLQKSKGYIDLDTNERLSNASELKIGHRYLIAEQKGLPINVFKMSYAGLRDYIGNHWFGYGHY